jgi:hypothetical protein
MPLLIVGKAMLFIFLAEGSLRLSRWALFRAVASPLLPPLIDL